MSPVHSVAVTIRRVIARRPWLYWIVVAAAALGIAATVHDELDDLRHARGSWGATRPVLMATDPIAPGAPLTVAVRDLPVAMVPDGALRGSPQEVATAVARQHIGAGEIVTEIDIAPGGGPLALLPAGWLAVPVFESVPSGAAIGDQVQPVSDGFVVSTEGLVIGTVDEALLIAVPTPDAPVLAGAAAAGAITLLRVP